MMHFLSVSSVLLHKGRRLKADESSLSLLRLTHGIFTPSYQAMDSHYRTKSCRQRHMLITSYLPRREVIFVTRVTPTRVLIILKEREEIITLSICSTFLLKQCSEFFLFYMVRIQETLSNPEIMSEMFYVCLSQLASAVFRAIGTSN